MKRKLNTSQVDGTGLSMNEKDVNIAVLQTKVDALIEKQKELTARVRANERVVAIVSAIGIGAGGIVGTTAFAPKAEAYPEYLEPRTQVIPGSLPNSAQTANDMINKLREWEWEQKKIDPAFDINNALAEYFNGSDDPTEQEELLQFPGNGDQQSIGWRYD